jgi:putative oxidoreductase
MMRMGNQLLKLGSIFSLAIALLHLVIIFVGAPAYRYFGAGEAMARKADSGSTYPTLLTLFLVVVFTIWCCYGLSGAGIIRRLPLLKIALVLIGMIFTFRGVAVFPQLFQMARASAEVAPRQLLFSLVSLVTGLTYLIGTILNWNCLDASKS